MITFFGVLYFHQLLHHIPCSVIIRLQYRQLSCNAVYSNQINIVTVVELGDICTGFTKARQKSILGDDEYGGRISRSVSQMEHDEQNGMDPARIDGTSPVLWRKRTRQSFMLPVHSINS